MVAAAPASRKPWTAAEIQQLIDYQAKGIGQGEVAAALGRTVNSVDKKIRLLRSKGTNVARPQPTLANTPPPTAEELHQIQVEAAATADTRVAVLEGELRGAKRRIATLQGRTALIVDEVREVLADTTFLINIPPRPAVDRRKHKREEIPVFHMGDTHFGHHEPRGPYAYTAKIAKQRIFMAVDKFLMTLVDRRQSAKIDTVHLFWLGDIVEGEAMRPGHGHEIEDSLLKQAVFWGPEALSGVVIRLLGEFRKIVIKAVPGNHGRNGPPRGDAHPSTNWDRVAYQVTRLMVEKALAQSKHPKRIDDIVWDLPTDREESHDGDDWYAVDYIFDWCCALLHGEDLRGKGWGGIPFYGVERMARRYADILDDPIDFLSIGHIHVDASIPSNFRQVFVNGSVEPGTRFIRKHLVSATHPSQKVVFFTADHGPVSQHTLYLTDNHLPHGKRILRALEKVR